MLSHYNYGFNIIKYLFESWTNCQMDYTYQLLLQASQKAYFLNWDGDMGQMDISACPGDWTVTLIII